METSISSRQEDKASRGSKDRLVLLLFSITLFMFLAICYLFRPDCCAAVTIFPAWVWAGIGLLVALLGIWRMGKRITSVLLVTWVVFALVFSDETIGLLRYPFSKHPQRSSLRVITLNCGGGIALAAAEVAQYHPDIVLLQESPGKKDVRTLAEQLYGSEGSCLWGADASIVAHGRIIAHPTPAGQWNYTQGRVLLHTGQEIDVVSLRLQPPVFRMDLWSPDCWRTQREDRIDRRKELQDIFSHTTEAAGNRPRILGGDFNMPARDAAFRVLRPALHDTFPGGGVGWGNTAINDFPFARIDQIWVSRHYCATRALARKTVYSDHRMMIVDLIPAVQKDGR